METGFVIFTIILTLVGVVAGFRIGYVVSCRRKAKGTVYVSIPSEGVSPSLFLELDGPADEIANEKYVTFEVRKTRQ